LETFADYEKVRNRAKIPESEFGLMRKRGGAIHDQFWCTRAERNNREADYDRWYGKRLYQCGRYLNHHLSAGHKKQEPKNKNGKYQHGLVRVESAHF